MSSPKNSAQDPDPSDAPAAETLSRLHLAVERAHDRKAVLERRLAGTSLEVPDWRFHRQVIRLGLYLSERVGLAAGDRVAIIAPLSPETLATEWAIVVQGGVSVAIAPHLDGKALLRALEAVAPRAAFIATAALDRLVEAAGGAGATGLPDLPPPLSEMEVVESLSSAPTGRSMSLSQAIELGGTLDTAERAQSFRARARAVTGDMPAFAVLSGDSAFTLVTHRDAVAHVRRFWSAAPARTGDVAYVTGELATVPLRMALRAFIADGRTRSVLGTPGLEREEIAIVRPRWILTSSGVRVAPASPLARADGTDGSRGGSPAARIRQWLTFRRA
jgi:acyl-CoA synthetase (AMP-forming)/AMP-acid ligase II